MSCHDFDLIVFGTFLPFMNSDLMFYEYLLIFHEILLRSLTLYMMSSELIVISFLCDDIS